jgi:NAD(P)-dependent dehydrogenase (short-subunit alcohol dehydrogenase family)
MIIEGSVVVVTGGASGIGRALAERFHMAGAAGIVVADIDGQWAGKVAERVGGMGVTCDVGAPGEIEALVAAARAVFGRIDIFCSNAGYSDAVGVGLTEPMDVFERITAVNLLSHVAAARAVIPEMVERGSGYLLQTLSSAALITGPSGPGYTLTKHGALGFAEWLTLNYGHLGVRVSCLCPNAVYTGMFGRSKDFDAPAVAPELGPLGEVLMPEDVAAMTVDAMASDEPFLILPHERVRDSFRRKGGDYDAWIARTRERLLRMAGAANDQAT